MPDKNLTADGKAGIENNANRQKLNDRLASIRRKIVVLSGKGGVGKSTVAVNLAVAAVMAGWRVGLLDVDIHGPSVPTMLGLEDAKISSGDDGLLPVDMEGLKVMSIGFLLRSRDDAIIWRGPMKMGVIEQFLRDVDWGTLDCLVIDSPPGTGDEPLSVCQLIGSVDGAVIVTTPQKMAEVDVRKAVSFCRQMKVPILGVIENMGGFTCPKCGTVTRVLSSGGGERIAADMEVSFLGSLPMDPAVVEAGDHGRPFMRYCAESSTAVAMSKIINVLAPWLKNESSAGKKKDINPAAAGREEEKPMRIAIPLTGGKLALHFGHCEHFALIDIDPAAKKMLKREDAPAPEHEPGLLPAWLAERGAHLIIAGGMGRRAQDLFQKQGIEVLVGAPAETPEKLVADYLSGTLSSGKNICDH